MYVWLVECALPTTLSGPTAYIWLVIHLTSVHSDISSCSVCYTPDKFCDVTFIYVIFSSMLNICSIVAMKGIFPVFSIKMYKPFKLECLANLSLSYFLCNYWWDCRQLLVDYHLCKVWWANVKKISQVKFQNVWKKKIISK